jgi:hypothetical protein
MLEGTQTLESLSYPVCALPWGLFKANGGRIGQPKSPIHEGFPRLRP